METKTKMHKYVGWRQQRATQNSSNASLSVLKGAENREYALVNYHKNKSAMLKVSNSSTGQYVKLDDTTVI